MVGQIGRAALACLAMAAFAAPASADVLEIADDGAVTTYRGPAVYTDAGAAAVLAKGAAPAHAQPQTNTGDVRRAIAQAAGRYALSPALVEAVAWQESRLQHRAISPQGAVGVMQLMPATARDLGVDPADMTQNVEGGAAYLSHLLRRYRGDLRLALAAYNAGPGAVDRHGGVPPYAETRRYVSDILGRVAPTRR